MSEGSAARRARADVEYEVFRERQRAQMEVEARAFRVKQEEKIKEEDLRSELDGQVHREPAGSTRERDAEALL
jgi:hypothetical protein